MVARDSVLLFLGIGRHTQDGTEGRSRNYHFIINEISLFHKYHKKPSNSKADFSAKHLFLRAVRPSVLVGGAAL